jgi:Alpha/beta hydrolase domain
MRERLFRLFLAANLLCVASVAGAAVTSVDVTSRTDVPYGYERIAGTIHFSVDPADPHNAVIADIDKAPRDAQGKVEFSSQFVILRPKNGPGSGVALVDIVNRGNETVKRFNLVTSNGAGSDDPDAKASAPDEDLGDGFLMKMGVTVVEVGWEFDVTRKNGLRITVPVVTTNGRPASGMVTAAVIPTEGGDTASVGDLAGYQPADPDAADSVLRVRENVFTNAVQVIPRANWRLTGNEITLEGGFTPGRVYELTYRASHLPIGGLGFAAVRDAAAWVKHAPDALASARYLYTFGSSQSGRFLRTFLYQGFNTDEQGRQVFDGVMAHIAGASRLVLNRRASTPTTLAMFTATAYPFADNAVPDPVSGQSEGLLDNPRARENQPKIMYTNTGVEYWGGGRVAALIHTSPDGSKDLTLPDNVRVYFLAGAQHSPARFPPKIDHGQQIDNPTDYWWALRALFVAMDHWVREGTPPPPSQYPRVATHTLVQAANVAFPTIPHVQSPEHLTAGFRIANMFLKGGAAKGVPLPLLVPQVDADGNETTGIRLPEQAVPLGTYTGWNFRNTKIGAPDQLYPLLGSYVPFAKTKADRMKSGDPRLSIEERYPTHAEYSQKIATSAEALVKGGYLLAGDVKAVEQRAEEHWDWSTR